MVTRPEQTWTVGESKGFVRSFFLSGWWIAPWNSDPETNRKIESNVSKAFNWNVITSIVFDLNFPIIPSSWSLFLSRGHGNSPTHVNLIFRVNLRHLFISPNAPLVPCRTCRRVRGRERKAWIGEYCKNVLIQFQGVILGLAKFQLSPSSRGRRGASRRLRVSWTTTASGGGECVHPPGTVCTG